MREIGDKGLKSWGRGERQGEKTTRRFRQTGQTREREREEIKEKDETRKGESGRAGDKTVKQIGV